MSSISLSLPSSLAFAGELSLKNEPLDTVELHQIVADIQSNTEQAASVIRKMRVLLRRDTPVLIPIDLNQLIEETVALARLHPVLIRVSIRLRLVPGLPQVHADRVQIQQVLLNLIRNSAEAMQAVKTPEKTKSRRRSWLA